MSISTVRTYLKARLKETDTSLREWKDGFNSSNIPSNIFHKAYHISYQQDATNETSGNFIDLNVSAEVLIFYKGYRNVQNGYDAALDLGTKFKRRVCNPSKVTGDIKKVDCNSVVIEPVEDNDNSFIVRLDLDIRMMFNTL